MSLMRGSRTSSGPTASLWDADPVRQRLGAAEPVPRPCRRTLAVGGRLGDKVATALTSSQTAHGVQESTTLALNNNTLCHRGDHRSIGYTVHEIFNGAGDPYGASFIESYTRTSVVRGIFRKKAEARAEALELLRAA
jgi:multimeric flavodoxin WrbA